jgi:transglutaminase-like putative cysteine protease
MTVTEQAPTTRFRVVHETEYRYEAPVTSSYGQVCLLPRPAPGQLCRDSTLTVEPRPTDRRERVDFFGNRVGYFHVDTKHTTLRISARSDVEVNRTGVDPRLVGPQAELDLAAAVSGLERLDGADRTEVACYRLPSQRTPLDAMVRSYAAESFSDDRPVLDSIRDLTARIHGDFEFAPDATKVTSTVADLFETGAGVCQDFAHLAVSCLRASGLPGRYVSGYLETDPPPGKEKIYGADVSHAWASALIPGIGWVDFDPTNNQLINERYIIAAWGRDYADVSPVSGVIYSDGGTTALNVSVDVSRVG